MTTLQEREAMEYTIVVAETANSLAILQDLAPYYAPQEEVLSDSSESLLSGSPAFATGTVSSGLATGSSAGFLFASLSFSCSVGSTHKNLRQGIINLFC